MRRKEIIRALEDITANMLDCDEINDIISKLSVKKNGEMSKKEIKQKLSRTLEALKELDEQDGYDLMKENIEFICK